MAAIATNSLLWQYLSVLVTFSLPSLFIERARARAATGRRLVEEEGRRERATSSHGLCFALAAANAKEGAKEEAEPLQSRPPQNQGKGRDGG